VAINVFGALPPRSLLPADEFTRRVDEILRMLKAAAPGVERVLVPGEVEFVAEERNRKFGFSLAKEVVQQLAGLGKQVGVHFPSVATVCT
jgi:LDH2 family malate/lactate/ureidoglycolate dehydrogenase